MKPASIFLLFLVTSSLSIARVLEVRAGGTYTNLEAAARDVLPGDTILFRGGVYAGGQFVGELQGRADAWITIMAAPGEEVILRGGTNAWQLSDPAYLRIVGFVIEGQTGNGLNIDDGGSFETPAHHLVIERCEWRGIAATGNNDQLKMSGIDSFEVRDCSFRDGAANGSMIDMVGCHDGSFVRNRFERAGSNCIQAKGGTRSIRIERNTFIDGGARSLNIGGSTGLEFFRPLNANYEAAEIRVYSNVFTGSEAPIAFVGAVNSEVVNNTIWLPGTWAIRILQETTGARFLQCGDNTFRNNIVVVGSDAANPTINVGSNTRSETFTFSNNLWYNIDNPGWNGPNLPAAETNGLIGRDPMLVSPPADMAPRSGSPAIGAGLPVAGPTLDYLGRPFVSPPSIGAIEGGATSSIERERVDLSVGVTVATAGDHATVRFMLHLPGTVEVAIHDMRGEPRWSETAERGVGEGSLRVPFDGLPSGRYLCVVRCGETLAAKPIVVVR